MLRQILTTAAICVLFTPMLYCDMSSGGGMGMSGQGTAGQGIGSQMGNSSFGTGSYLQGSGSSSTVGNAQQGSSTGLIKYPAKAEKVKVNNVDDILSFEEKLNLTSQQLVSIQMISADLKQDADEKAKTLLKCREEFDKSLEQMRPDFTYIREMLKELTDAQTSVETAPVDAYEKAYMFLNEDQKVKLKFFRAVRQEEIEAKEKAAQDNAQNPSPSPSSGGHSMPSSGSGPTMLGH